MFTLIYPKNEFDAQLYDFPGTDCHFNIGFNTSISVVFLFVAFLRSQLSRAYCIAPTYLGLGPVKIQQNYT
jgi:hypothetical protein